MRRDLSAVAGVMAMLGVSGCTIHPTTEAAFRLSTVDIVQQVRCEARDAVLDQVLDGLRKASEHYKTHDPARAARVRALGANLERVALRGGTYDFDAVERHLATVLGRNDTSGVLAALLHFKDWAIGYHFIFDIETTLDRSLDISLKDPRSAGFLSIGFGGGLERKRLASREFKFAEPFEKLGRIEHCVRGTLSANVVYPIAGKIGLSEVVDTFFGLYAIQPDMEDFTDQIRFTTRAHGKLNPAIELSPATQGLFLAKASADLTNQRKDVHELTVTFSLPSSPRKNAVDAIPVAARERGQATRSGSASAKTKAIDTLRRKETRDILDGRALLIRDGVL